MESTSTNTPTKTPAPDENALLRLQALVRGHQVRRHYRVRTVAPGVIHTRVTGTQSHFAQVGIDIQRRYNKHVKGGPELTRQIDLLAVDPGSFQGGVIGGQQLQTPDLTSAQSQPGTSRVFINASYFNMDQRGSTQEAMHAPVGKTIAEGQRLRSLSLPADYKKDYLTVRPDPGGKDQIETAPVLSGWTKPLFKSPVFGNQFPPSRERDARYQYRDPKGKPYPNVDIPGTLHHAGDPNERSALILPGTGTQSGGMASPSKQDRVRLMTATGPDLRDQGFSLSELAAATTRVSTFNQHPGTAVNLDGGNSVFMGVTDPSNKLAFHVRGGGPKSAPRPVSTLIQYHRRGGETQ